MVISSRISGFRVDPGMDVLWDSSSGVWINWVAIYIVWNVVDSPEGRDPDFQP